MRAAWVAVERNTFDPVNTDTGYVRMWRSDSAAHMKLAACFSVRGG